MRIYLEQLANEMLGVPDNLIEISEQIYDNLLKDLEHEINTPNGSSPIDVRDKIELNSVGPFKTSFVTFDNIKIVVKFHDLRGISTKDGKPFTKITNIGAQFVFNAELSPTSKYKRLIAKNTGDVTIVIDIAVDPYTNTWKDVYDYLVNERQDVVPTLSHELKHAFDKAVEAERGEDIVTRLQYSDVMEDKGIKELNDFGFLLYYTSLIENSVRPTEFASLLRQNDIDRKDFLTFLQKSEAYEHLKKAKEFSTDKMKAEIMANPESMAFIKNILKRNRVDIKKLTDEQIVDEMLGLYVIANSNSILGKYKDTVENLGRGLVLSGIVSRNEFLSDVNESFNEMINKLFKNQNDPGKFFRQAEKRLNYNGDKMIRRLAKLFAYIDVYKNKQL